MSDEKKVYETDTGDALFSEVLGIPLLIRGEPSTQLLNSTTMSESLGIPCIIKNAKPFSGLASGTLGSWIGLPEILK